MKWCVVVQVLDESCATARPRWLCPSAWPVARGVERRVDNQFRDTNAYNWLLKTETVPSHYIVTVQFFPRERPCLTLTLPGFMNPEL